jgi:predicted ribosomally synthesized peptide with nif11-like leader
MKVNQTVKNFFEKLAEDEALRGKLEAAAGRQDLAECALLSREAGFDFTRADLEYLANLAQAYQNGELNDEQLEMVSGGVVAEITLGVMLVILGIAGAGAGIGLAVSCSLADSKR